MIPIYICDGSAEFRQKLESKINNIITKEKLNMKIVCNTGSMEELLIYLKNHIERSVYFLDMHIEENLLDGIQLAKKIRNYDKRGFITIITEHRMLYPLVIKHRIEALDYIFKDETDTEERLLSCLSTVIKRDY